MHSRVFHSVLLVCAWLGSSVVRGEHEHHQGEDLQADTAESNSHQEHMVESQYCRWDPTLQRWISWSRKIPLMVGIYI